MDWLAAGLPSDGENAERPRAGDVADKDVPRCGLDELLGTVRDRVTSAGFQTCVVTNDQGVVLGLLRSTDLDGDDVARVADVMHPGPSTYRPFVAVTEMAKRMTEHDITTTLITSSDGKLIGLLRREDAVRAASERSAG